MRKKIEIWKGCMDRLDEVYSVIMAFGGKESTPILNKIDDVQNHLEEIFEVDRNDAEFSNIWFDGEMLDVAFSNTSFKDKAKE